MTPKISDLALIRYCERELDFSFEEMREHLLTDKVKKMIEFGARKIKTERGYFKIKEGVMVTYIANKDHE